MIKYNINIKYNIYIKTHLLKHMSTIQVEPAKSGWGTSSYSRTPHRHLPNTTATETNFEEFGYLSMLLMSIVVFVATFLLKGKA